MSKYKYKKKKGKGKIIAIILAILAVAVAAAWLVTDRYYIEGKSRLEPEKYYKMENIAPNRGLIVLNGEVADSTCFMYNGDGYLPVEYVADNLNNRFFTDEETDSVLYTTGIGTIELTPGAVDYSADDGERIHTERPILIKENDRLYIDAEFVQKFTPMQSITGHDPDRIAILYSEDGWTSANIKEDGVVRYYAGIKSDIIADVKAGDKVQVLEPEGDWTKVYTADGFTGYIKNELLSAASEESFTTEDEQSYTHITKEEPITMAWFAVTNATANSFFEENTKEVKGLDVIAPTWYSYADNKGTINDYSSAEIVEQMHAKGYEVWPVVSDLSGNLDVNAMLESTSLRRRMIDRIIDDAVYMKYEGVNIDFEKVTESSADAFMQFVRELSVECRKNGIVLSVDNYAPRAYNSFYDLKEQAKYADYIVIMNYDEHYAGSQEAGSVSSRDYFRESIDIALKYTEPDRIINALPFYTRVWGVNASGSIVDNQAVAMQTAQETVTKNNAKTEWDEATGQNLATYTKDNKHYSIWLEDSKSIQWRLDETKERGLAGAAFWRIGYETPDIWTLVEKYKK